MEAGKLVLIKVRQDRFLAAAQAMLPGCKTFCSISSMGNEIYHLEV